MKMHTSKLRTNELIFTLCALAIKVNSVGKYSMLENANLCQHLAHKPSAVVDEKKWRAQQESWLLSLVEF